MNRTEGKNDYVILVSGHRNPDIDSLASAVALAELRRRQTKRKVTALCPGVLSDRAKHLFSRFGLTPPESCNDVYPRVRDLMCEVPAIPGGSTLFDAVGRLRESGLPRLPVIGGDGKFLGMLSSLNLLSDLLSSGRDEGRGLTGRRVHSSLELIAKVLEGEYLTSFQPETAQDFEVYVAAMGLDSFEEHLPANNRELAVIVGDRPEIHLYAVNRKLRLMIVTGSRPVDPLILQAAKTFEVSILVTPLDSATVIRRLKFSAPVEQTRFPEDQLELTPSDRIRDVRNQILGHFEDVIPVVDCDRRLTGAVFKQRLNAPPPFRMILVDHNEIEQSLPGVEEIPIIEVVDHHRIGMMPTATPIKFTGDVVGSTCTLVAAMFRSCGESLGADLAGLLLGGIISDTLLLKSPTTADLDRRMAEWLEKVSGVTGETLMQELMSIDSALAVKPAEEVIGGDRKDYTDHELHFALAQVEETNLELLHQRRDELAAEIRRAVERDKLDFFGLLVTDAVRETSQLLAIGRPEIVRSLPYRKIGPELFDLPGILSRKKQLLPQMLSITAAVGK